MTTTPHLLAIRISNFRSIVEPLEIPLKNKITFLVGQNNVGKTGILRFLGLLLNNGGIIPEDVSLFTPSLPEVNYLLATEALRELAKGTIGMKAAIKKDTPNHYTAVRRFDQKNTTKLSDDVFQIFETDYFEGSTNFKNDFATVSSQEANVAFFQNFLWNQLNLPTTIYVPSQRMILAGGVAAVPQFGQVDFPGIKIDLTTIVVELARLDRPEGTPTQRQEAREKLSKICSFVAYCLEVTSVEIKVPVENRTIYVTIDGNEQPISNLGSGIEQLIVIGMGSFKFPDQLVLIDEPELHFHPRTQKRMMKYLNDHAEAKFVIATHSAAILDSVEADIVQIWKDNHQCFGRTVQSNSDRYEAVRNLCHSPSELVLANFVIWVEGPSDRIFINRWIQKIAPDLSEGTDYAIIFYGGSILARHGFEDDDTDLVKALSIARNFAVYMDSDKSAETDGLKKRVERVSAETISNGGMSWISAGREIENYVPQSVLLQLKGFELNPAQQFGKVVKADKFDKVKFAEQATKLWGDEWPLDLKARCDELVEKIRLAR